MSSENETLQNNLDSNIQYIIEDVPSIPEELTINVQESQPEFALQHIEEMVESTPVTFFSSPSPSSEEIPSMPAVEEEPVVSPSVEEVVEEPVATPSVEDVVEEPVATPSVEEVVVVEEPVATPSVEGIEDVVEEPVAAPSTEGIEEVVEEPVATPSVEEVVVEVEEPVAIVPKLVFIVPYRDRDQQYLFFSQHMKVILEDIPTSDYEIFYIHQCDTREFNRGAMKNIGFLYVKEKYPTDYKNITLVFNDIDTMPYVKNFLNYETTNGIIKHFYGFKFTLGGIVSIKAGDFEKINGFPNFWAWGYEDNLLQKRVLDFGLSIDRSQFFPLMDKNILQMKDGLNRIVNRSEFDRYMSETTEGILSIKNLTYSVDSSKGFVNVSAFNTDNDPVPTLNAVHDLRNGNNPFNVNKQVMGNSTRRGRARMGMSIM